MTAAIYNASVALGVLMLAIGAGAQWGWPVGMMVSGALVLGLTAYTLRILRAR